jgi:hypothetical protein
MSWKDFTLLSAKINGLKKENLSLLKHKVDNLSN